MRTLFTLPLIMAAWLVFGPTHPATPAAPLPVHSGRYADGRAVEVVGDPTTADRIVVLIPGVDTDAANFDRGLGGVQRRSPAWQAHQLDHEIQAIEPGAPVAVIAWLGYDAPEGVRLAAVREDRAATGAQELRGFLAELTARRIVLVGHSYGSTVAGLAAPGLDRRVTDIVALGSPGMGVDTARDLHTTARVWAGTAPSDWTRLIPGVQFGGAGHDTRPTDPGFGALPLPVAGVDGHDGYFVSGTASLHALAEITLGDHT